MGLKFEAKEGDTELSHEELDLIIPGHVTTRKQLDEVEQNNIEEAFQWLLSLKTIEASKLFSEEFQDLLHKKMFGNVWKWGGEQRKKETNVGVKPNQIVVERKKLNEDALFWIHNNTWDPTETALRFHHRLVQIHCYPNGNGRHSRIIADTILEKIYNKDPLTWIYSDLLNDTKGRREYISALKAADKGDYSLLIKSVEKTTK
ncbi:MAG: mobile mystery protein B [Bacteroidota bacterium]|nr:mobile mystery protein B [Bacteroidota bacterium]